MSTLLKALKKAEQDRREKLQAAAAAASPTTSPPQQLSLPVDDHATANAAAAVAPAPVRPHINPLLIPAPVAPEKPRFAGVGVLVGVATVVAVAANMLYRPDPPAAPAAALIAAAPAPGGNAGPRLTLDTVTIPRALLGAGPDPLQLQLDRRAELRPGRSGAGR